MILSRPHLDNLNSDEILVTVLENVKSPDHLPSSDCTSLDVAIKDELDFLLKNCARPILLN